MFCFTARGLEWKARLCFIAHGLMENCSRLIVDTRLTRVSGHAERLAALEMIEARSDSLRADCPKEALSAKS
jgi:hypothetical protein